MRDERAHDHEEVVDVVGGALLALALDRHGDMSRVLLDDQLGQV